MTGTTFEIALIHQTTKGVRIEARVKPPPRELPLFSLVLFSMGLGDEQCVIDGHGGPAFWEPDSFERPRLGLKRKPRVLVSGGGDGALQDFIRLVTGEKSALDVYESFDLPRQRRSELEQAIAWAEDHWQRSAVWSTKQWDCTLLRNLHREYARQIKSIPQRSWTRLNKKLKLRGPSEFDIKLIHSCDHFGPCYALHHFVALSLSHLLKMRGLDPIQDGRRVARIHGDGCDKSGCLGLDHRVFSVASECSRPNAASPLLEEGIFQALVLRHGIAFPSPLVNASGVQIRQMLPSHNPWPSLTKP